VGLSLRAISRKWYGRLRAFTHVVGFLYLKNKKMKKTYFVLIILLLASTVTGFFYLFNKERNIKEQKQYIMFHESFTSI
jgi:hypothetical protein